MTCNAREESKPINWNRLVLWNKVVTRFQLIHVTRVYINFLVPIDKTRYPQHLYHIFKHVLLVHQKDWRRFLRSFKLHSVSTSFVFVTVFLHFDFSAVTYFWGSSQVNPNLTRPKKWTISWFTNYVGYNIT